jgi:hypothetical protein
MIKDGECSWRVVLKEETKVAYSVLVGKPEGRNN